jgi:predicted ATPase/DNA-binding XRE family transcriptional regulator
MEDTALGSLLRRYRRGARLTQEELAERAGISARTVSDVERGLRYGIYPDTAARIAAAVGMSPEDQAAFEAAARRPRADRQREGSPMPALPMTTTHLVGRDRELAAILAKLRDPGLRLLTLTGPGGIGKTRLAIEASSAAQADFPDGTCFISLEETRDAKVVPMVLARALGVNPVREPVVSLVNERIGDKRILLVLDTFEHVLEAALVVADLLAGCPRLTVLVSSRAPLRLRGEHEFPVPPLGLETDGPAAALFAERARAVRPDVSARDEISTVAEVCRRLDGLPLAIELAAARVRHMSLAAIRDHLDDRLGLLTGGPRDLPPRQRAMRDTVGWSYDLLDPSGQRLLRRLSVFAGWTLDSAFAVCGAGRSYSDVLAELSNLVDQSLVVLSDVSSGEPRYRMLDVVRDYAAQRLDALGERKPAASAHAAHFVNLVEEAEPELRRAEQRGWHRRLEIELPNLRLAFRWWVQSSDAENALRLSGGMWMFWLWQGGLAEGRQWLTDAIAMVADDPTRYPVASAKALWGAGWLAYHQGDFADAAALGEALLELAGRTGNPIDVRNGLTLGGMLAMAEGRYGDAIPPFEQALQICRDLQPGWLLATSTLNLAAAVLHAGDVPRAETLFSEAQVRYRDLGDSAYEARAIRHLATCRLQQGDLATANELLRTCVLTEPGGDWGLAESLDGLSLVKAAHGDAYQAALLAGAADTLRDRIGARSHPFDVALGEPFRAALDRDPWDEGWQVGREMPVSEVVGIAVEP